MPPPPATRCPKCHGAISESAAALNLVCAACGKFAQPATQSLLSLLDVAAGDTWSLVPPSTLDAAEESRPGAAKASRPDAPKRVGRFIIRTWLGEGAFGVVFRAHDPQLDREVALKILKPEQLDSARRVQRFFREAKAAANLRHPNIVPVFDCGRDAGHCYLTSAFVAGRSLAAELQDQQGAQRLPPGRAATIARRLAEALSYAHRHGVIHRDIKPANVLLDESGEPLIADFGLALRPEPGDERLTQEGANGMGTPAYMAPEQARGQAVAASDQYSLGCSLLKC